MALQTVRVADSVVANIGQVTPKIKKDNHDDEYHATNDDGRLLYVVNVVIKNAKGGLEGINVTVPEDDKGRIPGTGIVEMSPVRFHELEAGFYAGENGSGWWFRAAAVAPASAPAQRPAPAQG